MVMRNCLEAAINLIGPFERHNIMPSLQASLWPWQVLLGVETTGVNDHGLVQCLFAPFDNQSPAATYGPDPADDVS
ncbi:hypothetical protein N7540_002273 [Penicillium herquei]|nr:hypothetical protein N7540_002273 [Penicillium herquei]